MLDPVRDWFARQSLLVRLGALLAVLLLGLVWVSIPDDGAVSRSTQVSPRATAAVAPGDRPVLPREAAGGSAVTPSGTASAGFLAPYQEPERTDPTVTWYGALRAIISVAVVLVLIVVGAQALRAIGLGGVTTGRGVSIRVRETVKLPSVGSKGSASLHLVEVGERLLLIGASDGSVTLVTEFEQDEIEALPGAGTPRGPGAMTRMTGQGDGEVGVARSGPLEPVGDQGADAAVMAAVLRRLDESKRRLRGDE